MPRTQPRLNEVIPHPDGRPMTRKEKQEARAIRLALVMVAAALHQLGFINPHKPIAGSHASAFLWLHRRLGPLAEVSSTVRKIRTIFDPLNYSKTWFDPAQARKNLRQLIRAAQRLAQQDAQHSVSSRPGQKHR